MYPPPLQIGDVVAFLAPFLQHHPMCINPHVPALPYPAPGTTTLQIGDVVAFLASDAASYMSGQVRYLHEKGGGGERVP